MVHVCVTAPTSIVAGVHRRCRCTCVYHRTCVYCCLCTSLSVICMLLFVCIVVDDMYVVVCVHRCR